MNFMEYGIIIPTQEEAVGVPEKTGAAIVCGYGAGKAAGCAAAAEVIFRHGCRTILLWGSVGATANSGLKPGDVLVASKAAYRDFDLSPALGCTRVGEVPGFTAGWIDCDAILTGKLRRALAQLLPDAYRKEEFPLASGDRFYIPEADEANCIEKDALIYDMEAAALLHFGKMLNDKMQMNIKIGIVKVISNLPQDENTHDFAAAAHKYCRPVNAAIPQLIKMLKE